MNEENVEKDKEEEQYNQENRQRRKRKFVIIKNNGRTLPNEKHSEDEEENSPPKVKNKNNFKYRLLRIIKEDCFVTCVLQYLGTLLFGCGFLLPFGLLSARRITYQEKSLLVTDGPVPISVQCVTVCVVIFSPFFYFVDAFLFIFIFLQTPGYFTFS